MACPPLMVTGPPSGLALSMKIIVPVGVPGLVDVTVAVKVTDCPKFEGFAEDMTVGTVAAPTDAVGVPVASIVIGLPGAVVPT